MAKKMNPFIKEMKESKKMEKSEKGMKGKAKASDMKLDKKVDAWKKKIGSKKMKGC